MKTTPFVLALFTAFGLTLVAHAEDKVDVKKLLVGKWEAVKADEGTLPVGAIVEMTKDGKLKVEAKKDGKEASHSGTYTVDGDTFTIKLDLNGKEYTQKISVKKITDSEMSTANEMGKAVSFKRVK
jgi:uncharacterized protein (TIGR03066 family)